MIFSIIYSIKVSLDLGGSVWLAILYVLCGLGIFLYGIDMMGGSLKSLCGNKMKIIIEKSTNSPIKGLVVGFLITMLTQSSSGTSALAVSLVAVGLMTFPQALGILLGANIGGTVLTIIMAGFQSINIMPVVSVILVAVGAAMVFFFKKKKIKQIGSVILGFGLIFLGLSFISMSMKTIQNSYASQIESVFKRLADLPVLGVVVGTLFTFIVQSSSATIGIVQEMYASATIPLKGALAIMLGANIGTTITAFIASLGSSKAAKKVAIANILIKLFGVIIFMCLWIPYKNLVLWFNDIIFKDTNNSMIIAIAHLFFNVVNSFIFLALLTTLTKLCNKIIKGDDESDMEKQLSDYELTKKSPALAIGFAKTAIDYMANLTVDFFELTKEYSFNNISNAVDKAQQFEKEINGLDKKIHDYLMQIAYKELSNKQSNTLFKYIDTIKDLERVGDHCTNIVEFFSQRYDAKLKLSDQGTIEMHNIYDKIDIMINNSYKAIKDWDVTAAQIVVDTEETVDDLEEKYRKHHVERLTKGICSVSSLDYYVDILSNLERIGDHANNIANNVINEEYLAGEVYNH